MTREEYTRQVDRILEAHQESAKAQLIAALPLIPAEAKRITFGIFVDQDGEGFLDVRLGLDGPGLYGLNRAIAQHAELFGTRMTEDGLDPALPLMSPGEEAFSVHDALTDCAAAWVVRLWNQIDHRGIQLPVDVVSHEGYGTTTPIGLK
jgi:hypothetical protein